MSFPNTTIKKKIEFHYFNFWPLFTTPFPWMCKMARPTVYGPLSSFSFIPKLHPTEGTASSDIHPKIDLTPSATFYGLAVNWEVYMKLKHLSWGPAQKIHRHIQSRLFIYLSELFQVYWCLPLHPFHSRWFFVTFLCMRTMLAINLHVKQLLRFSILGRKGRSIISLLKLRGSFQNRHRNRYINLSSLSIPKDSFTFSSHFPGVSLWPFTFPISKH